MPITLTCGALTWVCVVLQIIFGVKNTGRLSYISIVLPSVMILILLMRGVTLEGAGFGVEFFIGKWDLSVLTTMPEIWSKAAAQIFLTVGITSGVMSAYGSYNNEKQNVAQNSIIIAVLTSLL